MENNTQVLNGLRFGFALWVAIGHFLQIFGGSEFFTFPGANMLLAAGSAVDGFIFISGFLMAYHFLLRDPIEPMKAWSTKKIFVLRRLIRLYPIYFLAIITAYFSLPQIAFFKACIQAWLAGTAVVLAQTPISESWTHLLSHLTFTHGFFAAHESSVLDPAWSLSLEMQFYIIFPFLFFWLTKNWQKRLFPTVLVCVFLAVIFPKLFGFYLTPGKLAHFGQPSILPYKLALFLLGIITAVVFLKKLTTPWLVVASMCILPVQFKLSVWAILFTMAMLFLEDGRSLLPPKIYSFLKKVKKLLSSKLATWGADISYSLYLLHQLVFPVVIYGLIQCFNDTLGFGYPLIALSALSAFGTLFAICTFLYHAVEQPCIQKGKKWLASFR